MNASLLGQADLPPQLATPLAIVSLTGFAIQQAIQILDPFIMAFVAWYKNYRTSKSLPGGMTDAEFKKAVIAALSFGMGAIVTSTTGIRLLVLLGTAYGGWMDFIVTALVVGAGTEAANTIVKFTTYAKDSIKPKPPVSVVMNQPALTLPPGATFQFRVVMANTENRAVTWEVLHGPAGGTIDQTGLYTASTAPGTYTVCATSQADPTKSAVATVTVAKPPGT